MDYGQFGLILDILGAVLLFISASSGAFSVNFVKTLQDIAIESHEESVKKYNETVENNKTEKHRRWAMRKPIPYNINKSTNLKSIFYTALSYVGLGLLIAGFVFQFIQGYKN